MATRGGRYQGHCDKRVSLASRTLTRARARTSQACLPSRQIAYLLSWRASGRAIGPLVTIAVPIEISGKAPCAHFSPETLTPTPGAGSPSPGGMGP